MIIVLAALSAVLALAFPAFLAASASIYTYVYI